MDKLLRRVKYLSFAMLVVSPLFSNLLINPTRAFFASLRVHSILGMFRAYREKLNSMNLLLYMSPIAVLVLLPATLLMEPNVLEVTVPLGKEHKFMWLLLLVNSVMAYAANLSNFLVTKHTSALTLQVQFSLSFIFFLFFFIFHNCFAIYPLDFLICSKSMFCVIYRVLFMNLTKFIHEQCPSVYWQYYCLVSVNHDE